jgi:hypothetical protein
MSPTIEESVDGATISGGGTFKRIVLLGPAVGVIAAPMAASALSVSAQDTGQTDNICAPWSKSWDVSEGWWVFQWYRWCYDPSTSDPSVEENWYQELGDSEWWDRVNLCPESGSCMVSTG